MDAWVCLRARRWTVSVLRQKLRRSNSRRVVITTAIIIGLCCEQLPAASPTLGRPSEPAGAAAAIGAVRLSPTPGAPEFRQATPYDRWTNAPSLAGDLRQPVDVVNASIVPWRSPDSSPAPSAEVLSFDLAGRLREGPTYDGAQSVISPAEPLPAPGGVPLPTISDYAGEAIDPNDSAGFERPGHFARWFGPGIYAGGELLSSVPFDYKNFYSLRGLAWLGGGVGIAAIIANTPADQSFQDWYDGKIKSETSDRLVTDIRWLGRGHIMIPIFVAAGLVLTPFEERFPLAHGVGQWGRRTTRSLLVGGPMLLALQYAIGSYRPRREIDSHWHAFQTTNGVSGDAFIAGIVFISAAKQVENPLAKGVLYVAATVPAWGRINDDGHYLSQAFLGVWLAAVAVAAVDHTDRTTTTFVVPYAEHGAVGGRLGWRW
jgi:hypothetical protein